ncbi:hypothetical protein MAL1_00169 [Bacteriophage DSS3_MAL1]|nr:hypothetical protein MAL1_00169 [Bacteriophage DSS3_MAL1]
MKTILLVKHNHSVDGMGPSTIRFASEDREAIVDWISKKVPGNGWPKLRNGGDFESYMYDSFTLVEVPLFDAEDLRTADEAAARAKELEAQIKELQAELDAAHKVSV